MPPRGSCYILFFVSMFNIIVIYKQVWDGGGGKTIIEHNRSVNIAAALSSPGCAVSSNSTTTTTNSQDDPTIPPHEVDAFKFNFKQENGVYDKWRLFKVNYFVLTGEKWKDQSSRSTCLASQASVDRLYWLYTLVNHWDGPISIAVFVPDIEYSIAKSLLSFFTRCFPAIAERISFSFIYPEEYPPMVNLNLDDVIKDVPCFQYKDAVELLVEKRSPEMLKWRTSYPYPQNLHRNVARRMCQTKYIFTPDIDMIPNPSLARDLDTFLAGQKSCQKCAFVVPTYEISTKSQNLPTTKLQLLPMIKQKLARIFHISVYVNNQKSSNLVQWEKKVPQENEPLGIAYNVTNYIFKYEPLYVASADVPEFDERFIGFGMTRNTQVSEIYSIKLVSSLFALFSNSCNFSNRF